MSMRILVRCVCLLTSLLVHGALYVFCGMRQRHMAALSSRSAMPQQVGTAWNLPRNQGGLKDIAKFESAWVRVSVSWKRVREGPCVG